MNNFDSYLLITVFIVFLINISGYTFSYLIVSKIIGSEKQIQPKSVRDKNYLFQHTPLFILNVSILILFVFVGFYFFQEIIISSYLFDSALIIFIELFVILLFDDTFFYFLHRLMHENKFIYSKVHKVHHRANSPIPIDYIYVHPLEWMSGFIGPFIGILILGGVSIFTFWLYLLIRNIHELLIHSGLRSTYLNFPFYGTNEHHDIHHAKRNGNYSSTFTFWDYLFKTKI